MLAVSQDGMEDAAHMARDYLDRRLAGARLSLVATDKVTKWLSII
jgi:hypothetical protein